MGDYFFQPKRYLVTSALPYANGPLHIGHLTGAYLSADAYVRFLRLSGKDVVYVCGSDEHGAAITVKARKEGASPQHIVDKYHTLLKTTFDRIGIKFDFYHRTSDALHHETSQEFFRNLYGKGEFEEKESLQFYDEKAQQFLADRYILGTCPRCGHVEAYGDQCEKCGSSLSPEELINPKSTLSGAVPVLKPTKHWYLPLDKHGVWLRQWLDKGTIEDKPTHDPDLWKPHVLGQCRSWLDGGLQPRSMTRDLDWGVDVPQEIPGSAGKKLYVWLDAPIGYVSATRAWSEQTGKDWRKYWMDEETQLVHFIGKDNIVFHCLIFPAILKTHGDYILPKNVPANQFMNLEGRKISTSKQWAVWVHEYLDDFPGKEDLLRYVLFKNMPEQKDSEFTWKGFQEAVNADLVGNLANFIHRVMVLTHKFFEGKVPAFDDNTGFTGAFDPEFETYHEAEMVLLFDHLHDIGDNLRNFNFRDGLKRMLEVSSMGNQILQFNEPWKTYKDDPELVKVVLNYSLQIVAALSVVMRPFLPFTSDKLRFLLNLEPLTEAGELEDMLFRLSEGEVIMEPGHSIRPAEHLFSRVDDKVIEAQIAKLSGSKSDAVTSTKKFAPVKTEIIYDDFDKLDIRTGRIVNAEKVTNADKLLKLEVDLGFETRTIVSGIAQHFAPEALSGEMVLVVVNLAPRKLKGIESKGMILTAENEEGKLILVRPTSPWPEGQIVK